MVNTLKSFAIYIMWKHINYRFYDIKNCKVQLLNNIISYVAYRNYKFRMPWRFKQKDETSQSQREYVKNYIKKYEFHITLYLKSSKYITKRTSLIKYHVITGIHPRHFESACVYMCHIRGPCYGLCVYVCPPGWQEYNMYIN